MLTDTEEEQPKQIRKTRKHRSVSKQHKLNRSPSTKSPERSRKKLTKDEIKYQRFVNGLQKEIQIYLDRSLRESRFDPSGNRRSQVNSSFKSKRLTADVQAILTGPAFRNFYTQFIQSRGQNTSPMTRLRPLEESILWSNELE